MKEIFGPLPGVAGKGGFAPRITFNNFSVELISFAFAKELTQKTTFFAPNRHPNISNKCCFYPKP
ncbi:MAG TPA: hypothetical protein PLZ82_09545 [Smithellaceae bacterium]|nr:hypothetical protein [Syntrophaceae bacterium]NMC90886.1 hypothetical protein [Smithella sp.]HOD64877.1 hypothetical protein [Smithellaceae bacterium]HOR62962.1 hypothetical protein [Smithellaceae bacterium]HQH05634.1 hypothetical protein [Smithellaceae bacterium]